MRYAPKLYAIDSFFGILIMGLPVVPGLVVREFFNALTPAQVGLSPWGAIAALVAVGLGRIAVLFAGRFTKSQHCFTMSSLLRRNLLEAILNPPGAQPLVATGETERAVSPAEVISYFREDSDQIENNIAFISEVTGAGLFALGAITVLVQINARITLVVFLPLVVMVAVIQQAQKRIKQYRRASRHATQQVTGVVGEIFSAVQAIQVAGAEQAVLTHFRQVNETRRQRILRDRLFTAILDYSFQNLVSVGTGVILFFAASSMQSGTGTLTVGDFA